MILLDSNIVIYLEHPVLGEKIARQVSSRALNTCNMIVVEVLGYKDITSASAEKFTKLFVSMLNHPFDAVVTQKVIEIRRAIKIELPDAIIAATALVHDLELWTHNTADFKYVPGLRLFDPTV